MGNVLEIRDGKDLRLVQGIVLPGGRRAYAVVAISLNEVAMGCGDTTVLMSCTVGKGT
jgi:hypothetical protein